MLAVGVVLLWAAFVLGTVAPREDIAWQLTSFGCAAVGAVAVAIELSRP